MPELPEVEVVRRGLSRWIVGMTFHSVEIRHPRAIRRHFAGELDFTHRVVGNRVEAVHRRGKYLWIVLDSTDAVVAHLGMSGQLLLRSVDAPDERHLRMRFRFAHSRYELRFVDQRTFGGLSVDGASSGLPKSISHIAPDPLSAEFRENLFIAALRSRHTNIKRALLDQSLISGVGNIYADEALWRTRLNWARPTETLRRGEIQRLLSNLTDVLTEALGNGGTTFDSLYVNVNGESGYFSRLLAVYGRDGQPCLRCGTLIQRVPFMNRSSYFCPRCQPQPKNARK